MRAAIIHLGGGACFFKFYSDIVKLFEMRGWKKTDDDGGYSTEFEKIFGELGAVVNLSAPDKERPSRVRARLVFYPLDPNHDYYDLFHNEDNFSVTFLLEIELDGFPEATFNGGGGVEIAVEWGDPEIANNCLESPDTVEDIIANLLVKIKSDIEKFEKDLRELSDNFEDIIDSTIASLSEDFD